VVRPQPQLDFSISADGFYVYPRSTDTVVGGTVEPFAESEEPDPPVIAVLLRAARRILPELSDADVLRTLAGLRPYRRDSIRIDAETIGSCRVVHNYGHGGSGVTLSWGSAELAADLAER
jgi:D-amino-acid oxidase